MDRLRIKFKYPVIMVLVFVSIAILLTGCGSGKSSGNHVIDDCASAIRGLKENITNPDTLTIYRAAYHTDTKEAAHFQWRFEVSVVDNTNKYVEGIVYVVYSYDKNKWMVPSGELVNYIWPQVFAENTSSMSSAWLDEAVKLAR